MKRTNTFKSAARAVALSGMAAGLTFALADPAFAQDDAKIQRGHDVFQYWCAACHGAGIGSNGAPHVPGTSALLAKYKGALPALLEERTDLTPALVKAMVRQGVSIMPIFRKTEVSDADLDAVAAYLSRNYQK